MAQYGYASYRISSTYNVSSDAGEPVSKPFAPFVPKVNNGNDTSEGYVTKKKIVPVASRPYYSDNDESDDEWKQSVRGSPRKVDEFLTKVRPSSGFGDYRSNKPIGGTGTLNNGTNYGDKDGTKPFGGDHDDGYYNSGTNGYGGRKPIENTIRNNKYDIPNGYGQHKPMGSTMHDKYDGTNGYGDYGGNKGRKPIGGALNHDDYNNGYGDSDYANNNGYGYYNSGANGYGGRKPIENTIRNNKYGIPNGYGQHKPMGSTMHDKYDGTNGYGDYGGNKEVHKPVGNALNHDDYNHGYSDSDCASKEGLNPVEIPVVKKDHYDSYGGYGDYNNNKEGHKPTSIPSYEGYGIGNGHNKEKGKPFGSASPTRHAVEHHSGPKITSNWTAAPRIGTTLTKPINDIKEAIDLLKIEGEKLNGHKPPHENNPHRRRYDGPSNDKKAMDVANETERLKKIVPGRPTSVRPRFNPDGGKGHERDYVINHVQLQKKYNGISI